MTEWRAVPEFPGYEVSDDGRVRSVDRTVTIRQTALTSATRRQPGKILAQFWTGGRHRYLTVTLSRSGQSVPVKVHLLVLSVYAGPRPLGHGPAWRDGDRSNCASVNLHWRPVVGAAC